MPLKDSPEEVDTTLRPDGQQRDYLVLPDGERTQEGFVRPFRRKYRHVGRKLPENKPLRPTTEEEKRRYGSDFTHYEEYPEDRPFKSVLGRLWSADDVLRAAGACNCVTEMHAHIAETFARDPSFYSGTFCVGCGGHHPVEEFVWLDDNTRVGS